jgi:hypothetical protein
MSGTSGKGEIHFCAGQNCKFYNYFHPQKLTVTLIMFLLWSKTIRSLLTENYHLEFSYIISTDMALEILK